jgi:hypothetical protein
MGRLLNTERMGAAITIMQAKAKPVEGTLEDDEQIIADCIIF